MIEFEVPEMTCGGCASRISRALSSVLPDDARVDIDVATHRVRLHGPNGEDIEAYRSAIESVGYSARPVTAVPVGRGGGCCCCAARRSDLVHAHQGAASNAGGCCG